MDNNLIFKTILINAIVIVTIVLIICLSRSYSIIQSSNNVIFASNIELPQLADSNLKIEEVVSGLNMPTSMEFVGPNDFLILEKDGKIFRVINDIKSKEPILEIPVAKGFYQGLLGIATAKDSSKNNTHVFLYYTEASYEQDHNNKKSLKSNSTILHGNRVYRYELEDSKLLNPVMLLDLPVHPGPEDNGGFITIGPDNNLYIVVGGVTNESETSIHTMTQNYVNSTIIDGRGGILRTTLQGHPVLDESGNGILGDTYPLNLYFAYGLHNGFGMDFDPITRNLWNTETGHIINDEINIVKPGFNSGYAVIQGLSTFSPAAPAALVDFNGRGNYQDPKIVWEKKVVPTAIKFLTSNKLGIQYHNDIFVGTFLDNGNIFNFDLDKDRDNLLLPKQLSSKVVRNWNYTGLSEIVFGTGFGGISNLTVGPDGYLYVVSVVNGKIYRIMPNN